MLWSMSLCIPGLCGGGCFDWQVAVAAHLFRNIV